MTGRHGELRPPLISVVIPTHNRAGLVREAVQSVLGQTHVRWELLVVDDGSTDATRAYLESIADERVRTLFLDHSGNAALVRNVGAREARGSYIAFLDSDDLWHPQKLTLQVADFAEHADCRWSYTDTVLGDEGGRGGQRVGRGRPLPRGWILEAVVGGRAPIVTSSVLVERALLSAAGGFDESLPRSHDLDLWIRLAERSPASAVVGPLVTWRRHAGNRRASTPAMLGYRAGIYERLAQRTSSARLRRLCRRQRRSVTLDFVASFRHDGRYGEAFRALRRAWAFAGWHPRWWLETAKTGLRPLVPGPLLAAYRRIRASGARARS